MSKQEVEIRIVTAAGVVTKKAFREKVDSVFAVGFEDGFAGAVCNDNEFDANQALQYRKGFAAGAKAAESKSF